MRALTRVIAEVSPSGKFLCRIFSLPQRNSAQLSATQRKRLTVTLLAIAMLSVPLVSGIGVFPALADDVVFAPLVSLPKADTPTPNLDDYADKPFVDVTDDKTIVGFEQPNRTFFGGTYDKKGKFGFSGGVLDHFGFYFPAAHPDKPQITGGFGIGPTTVNGFVDADTSEWNVGIDTGVGSHNGESIVDVGVVTDSKGVTKVDVGKTLAF